MNSVAVNPDLIQKYNKPVPRYTSYPTVPFWNDKMSVEVWEDLFVRCYHEQNHTNGVSLYVHLPFCESLCTYCGCNKKITTNHKVEEEYLAVLEKEWKMYRRLMRQTPVIRSLHLGGGTPTFFAPKNLQKLLRILLKDSIIHPQHEFSVEGHPNNTTKEHLELFYRAGFRRISFGVQDNDSKVQHIINRVQPFENVERVTREARSLGFTSINFDLIYGLPLQTVESMRQTFKQVIGLRPDRIAFYSYAHVPWTSKAQRLFDESHLPDAKTKIQLYATGRELLLQVGYADIGMDHFALPGDELCLAKQEGRLHRNFMGYTTQHTKMLIGLGVSSISDTGTGYAQNTKRLQDYYEAIKAGRLAIDRGYVLNDEDSRFRQYILDIACHGRTLFNLSDVPMLTKYVFPKLNVLEEDGLVHCNQHGLQVTASGTYFLRTICAVFDLKLYRNGPSVNLFSKAV